jgi:hypothetical protein
MKMLIKSNTGSNCIPPLRNSINDENFDDIVYGDEDKWALLNKYSNSLISKLEEENVPLPVILLYLQISSFFSREFKIVLYSSINWWTEECF